MFMKSMAIPSTSPLNSFLRVGGLSWLNFASRAVPLKWLKTTDEYHFKEIFDTGFCNLEGMP